MMFRLRFVFEVTNPRSGNCKNVPGMLLRSDTTTSLLLNEVPNFLAVLKPGHISTHSPVYEGTEVNPPEARTCDKWSYQEFVIITKTWDPLVHRDLAKFVFDAPECAVRHEGQVLLKLTKV